MMNCKSCKTNKIHIVVDGPYEGFCLKCRRKLYYKEHKNEEHSTQRQWYIQHRDSEIIKNREYRKQHRELFDWYHNKQRFDGIRNEILDRDNYECQNCGSKNKLVIHHIDGTGYKSVKRMKLKKSNNNPDNLVTLCNNCHTDLHNKERR